MEHEWWIYGWVAAVAVILIVAVLLLTAIVLVRRIIGQAGQIIAALDGARVNTEPFYDIAHTNHALVRIAGALAPGDSSENASEMAR